MTISWERLIEGIFNKEYTKVLRNLPTSENFNWLPNSFVKSFIIKRRLNPKISFVYVLEKTCQTLLRILQRNLIKEFGKAYIYIQRKINKMLRKSSSQICSRFPKGGATLTRKMSVNQIRKIWQ